LVVILIEVCCIRELGASAGTRNVLSITFPRWSLAVALITSEVSAKLAMNTCIFLGRRAHAGMGSIFIECSGTRVYVAAFTLAAAICLVMAGLRFLLFITGILAGALVAMAANRVFGGVNGDAMGAANEVARAATLILWVVF
jgi:adenosylcobinamide-GDP ribazoletransferase